MMDDLEFKCAYAHKEGDGVKFSDNGEGEVYISAEDNWQHTEVILRREDAQALLNWLKEYLR